MRPRPGETFITIASCVRAEVQAVCNTHYQRPQVLQPQEQDTGDILIIEAVLYEAQTAPRLSFANFTMLREIADTVPDATSASTMLR